MSAETESKPARSAARSAGNGAGNAAEMEARLGVLEALAETQAEEIAALQQEQEGQRLALEALEKRMDRMASWAERKNQQMSHVMERLAERGQAQE